MSIYFESTTTQSMLRHHLESNERNCTSNIEYTPSENISSTVMSITIKKTKGGFLTHNLIHNNEAALNHTKGCTKHIKKVAIATKNSIFVGGAFILSILIAIIGAPLSAVHMVFQIVRFVSPRTGLKPLLIPFTWLLFLIPIIIRLIIHFAMLPVFGIVGVYYMVNTIVANNNKIQAKDLLFGPNNHANADFNELISQDEKACLLDSLPTQNTNCVQERKIAALVTSSCPDIYLQSTNHEESSNQHPNLENKSFDRFCTSITKHVWPLLELFYTNEPDPYITDQDIKLHNKKAKKFLRRNIKIQHKRNVYTK